MIWLRTAFLAIAWAIVSLIVHMSMGAPWGYVVMIGALTIILLWRAVRMQRVAQWARQPESTPPLSVGRWDDILAPLYRYTRAQSREIEAGREAMKSMLAAAQALPDGAVTLNADLQIDWANRMAQEHLGVRLPADRGHNILNLVRSPEFSAYAHQAEWPEPILVRVTRGHHDHLLMMQLTAYARDHRLLVTRDVTQIEKLETTRRDFVANVSHELRTPLTVLAGFLETLRDMPEEALSDEQREQYMALMTEQALRMQSIVADLLTLSTLESSPSAEPQRVRMSPVIEAARQQSEALSAGRHVFTWDIDPDLDVLGAEPEISSAVANLLTNAVRYTPDGGAIAVRWTREGNGARYAVKDSGIGIASRHIPRLTERFYRVDRGRSRAVGGTGLGLAITKHIAMRHDAELDIQSEVGKGSTFSLVFPAERLAEAESPL